MLRLFLFKKSYFIHGKRLHTSIHCNTYFEANNCVLTYKTEKYKIKIKHEVKQTIAIVIYILLKNTCICINCIIFQIILSKCVYIRFYYILYLFIYLTFMYIDFFYKIFCKLKQLTQ